MEFSSDVELFAALASRPRDEFGVLDEPVEAFEALKDRRDFLPLSAWCWFNPHGPTMCLCNSWSSPDGRLRAIGIFQLHHLDTRLTLHAVDDPEKVKDTDELARTIERLFERHGRTGEHVIFPTMPTAVDLRPCRTLLPRLAPVFDRVFRRAALDAPASDLRNSCEWMRRFPGDPHGRTQHEFLAAIADSFDDLKRINPGLQPSDLPDVGFDPMARSDEKATPADFERWWSMVTETSHVAAEIAAVRAWAG